MRLAWLGSSWGRAWGLALEPLKGCLDLIVVVTGHAQVQNRPGVCHGGRALGVSASHELLPVLLLVVLT